MVKRIYKLTKKAPRPPGPTDIYLGDVETGPETEDTEDTLRAMGFPIDKSLELYKNEEGLVFKKRIYRGENISYVATFDTSFLKKMLTSSDIDKKTKETIKKIFKQKQAQKS